MIIETPDNAIIQKKHIILLQFDHKVSLAHNMKTKIRPKDPSGRDWTIIRATLSIVRLTKQWGPFLPTCTQSV